MKKVMRKKIDNVNKVMMEFESLNKEWGNELSGNELWKGVYIDLLVYNGIDNDDVDNDDDDDYKELVKDSFLKMNRFDYGEYVLEYLYDVYN